MKKIYILGFMLIFYIFLFSACGKITTESTAKSEAESDFGEITIEDKDSDTEVKNSEAVSSSSELDSGKDSGSDSSGIVNSDSGKNSDTVTDSGTSNSGTVTDPWMLKATEDAGADYISSITFLGDSTIYGLLPYNVLPAGKQSTNVWYGAVGSTIALFNVETLKLKSYGFSGELSIAEAASQIKPDTLLIGLGVNGVATLDEEAFKYYYSYVIDTVLSNSPGTKIICQSIYPIARSYQNQSRINNTKIKQANIWINQIIESNYKAGKKVYYLDTYSVLVGSDGFLPETMQNGDGLHPTGECHNKILDNIRRHALTQQ